jgi:hypothetical protein
MVQTSINCGFIWILALDYALLKKLCDGFGAWCMPVNSVR